jgi:hypothetical protein
VLGAAYDELVHVVGPQVHDQSLRCHQDATGGVDRTQPSLVQRGAGDRGLPIGASRARR